MDLLFRALVSAEDGSAAGIVFPSLMIPVAVVGESCRSVPTAV
jgi:hypothetical protein